MTVNNTLKIGWILKSIVVISLLLLILTGCATSEKIKPARPGDIVDIHFLCRLHNGEVAVATEDKSIKKDQKRANIYLVRDKTDAVSVVIPGLAEKPPSEKEMTFEDYIVVRMAGHLTGLKEGEVSHVKLTAEDLPERKKEDYVIRMARVRERPKEIKMKIDEYRARTGKYPEIGQPFVFDPVIPGRIEAITEKDVIIRFSAKEGDVVQTPLGSGQIQVENNAYRIVIDAHKDDLVRTGHLVGRIMDVDDRFIVIDYRNPFGRETLFCDVTIDRVTDPKVQETTERH